MDALAAITAELAQRRQESRPRRPARRNRLSDVVTRQLARRGYVDEKTDDAIQSAWSDVVGESFARHTRIGAIDRGTLLVTVAHSAISQELAFRKAQILAELRRRLPQHGIKELRLRSGKA